MLPSGRGEAFTALDNTYSNTTGVQETGGGGMAFSSPPYAYALDAAGDVPNLVEICAGPQ